MYDTILRPLRWTLVTSIITGHSLSAPPQSVRVGLCIYVIRHAMWIVAVNRLANIAADLSRPPTVMGMYVRQKPRYFCCFFINSVHQLYTFLEVIGDDRVKSAFVFYRISN